MKNPCEICTKKSYCFEHPCKKSLDYIVWLTKFIKETERSKQWQIKYGLSAR